MEIEILEDILNELADKLCVYGACKSEKYDMCKQTNQFCCRVGFHIHYEDRIRKAIENENKLNKAGL